MKKLVDGIPVSYRQEISGGYYVSVTYCVDIHKFGQTEIKGTRQGLASTC